MISKKQANAFAADKTEMHKCIKRNGYFVADENSVSITLSMLYDCIEGRAWCPMQSNIRCYKQLANLPTIADFFERYRVAF
jgi:hypothetical protein